MPPVTPRDKTQEIIEIAKRVHDSGLWSDYFEIVFLSLATIQDTANNLFWGLCGASLGY